MVVVAERQSQREQPDNRMMCMYQPAGITETDINYFYQKYTTYAETKVNVSITSFIVLVKSIFFKLDLLSRSRETLIQKQSMIFFSKFKHC